MEEMQLPKLPVPDLTATLRRYLAGLQTVVSPAQMETTRRLVEDFGRPNGDGHRLQKKLIAFAEKSENWVTPLWLDDMYLRNPLPLPVNSNPFFLLPKQQFRTTGDQLRFAAKVIVFTLKYKERIESGILSPETIRGIPQCMSTYFRFFTAYRKPGLEADQLIIREKSNNHEKEQFIVAARNQFFSIEIPVDQILDPEAEKFYFDQLRDVNQRAKELWDSSSSQPPIGLMTTQDRRQWGDLYQKLHQKPINSASLRLLESCVFVLCLDEETSPPPSYSTIRRESITLDWASMAAHLLHGGGCHKNSANRWYDKFLQFAVSRDGLCGVLVEHSVSEGVTVLAFCDELMNLIDETIFSDEYEEGGVKAPSSGGGGGEGRFPPRLLTWELNEEANRALEQAAKNMNKIAENVDLYVLRFMEYGKEFIKSLEFSPDCFIQLALQLTHYKVHRQLVSTYESASLRRFHLGRVDNIRSNTNEALKWVRTMCDEVEATNEEKWRLFCQAMQKQSDVMKYTVSGLGPDNHLMALREMARIEKFPEPKLYKDKAYQQYLDFKLSTSQLPNEHGILIGYGAVVPDGYGCCYVPCSDRIIFCVSSFFGDEATSSDFFSLSLEGSLLQMRELCLRKER